MPAVMEAIDRMTSDERVKTMEYLWAVMTAVAAPAWHGDVLAERRRRVQSGEEEFIAIAESKRRLREARVYGVLDNRRDPSWIYNHLQESKGVK